MDGFSSTPPHHGRVKAELLLSDVSCEDTIGEISMIRHEDGRVEVTVGQHQAFLSGTDGAESLRVEVGEDRVLRVAVGDEEKWSLPLSQGEFRNLGGPEVMYEISGPEPTGPRF